MAFVSCSDRSSITVPCQSIPSYPIQFTTREHLTNTARPRSARPPLSFSPSPRRIPSPSIPVTPRSIRPGRSPSSRARRRRRRRALSASVSFSAPEGVPGPLGPWRSTRCRRPPCRTASRSRFGGSCDGGDDRPTTRPTDRPHRARRRTAPPTGFRRIARPLPQRSRSALVRGTAARTTARGLRRHRADRSDRKAPGNCAGKPRISTLPVPPASRPAWPRNSESLGGRQHNEDGRPAWIQRFPPPRRS
mmetsp:Transcript_5930/g.14746  ORF Transcript_5930/g.14746 Transcript_5930/m.14746 type:complete len:248 (+) Transcript_5930:280-1023(+)